MAHSKTYKVRTEGAVVSLDATAETIEDLARSIRSNQADPYRIAQDADAIMHLAADIRWHAEKRKRMPLRRAVSRQ